MERRERFCAFAFALSLCLAGSPAHSRADNLEKAVAAVNGMSDEALRKEFERRFQKNKSRSRSVTVTTRSVSRGLSSVDDATLVAAVRVSSRAIYGSDDRKDWYQISPAERVQPLARASVALFDAAKLDAPVNGMVRLKTKPFGELKRLCTTPKAKFTEQPSGAFCSGTLVRSDLVLTAGHCVPEVSGNGALPPNIAGVRFVFGYLMRRAAADASAVPESNVFSGKEVVGGEDGDSSDVNRHDWALVRLDRPVPSSVAEPVTNWENASVSKGERVFVMGFPAGLPLKYAPNARVRDASNAAWFIANLDTFGGNSGSGVYDQASKRLIGILVEGEVDYVPDRARGCYLVNLCPDNGCSGETVSRISQVRVPD